MSNSGPSDRGFNHIGASWPALTPDQRARVEANLPLIHWTLTRMRVHRDEYDDRAQDATLGLIRAAELYDPDKGFTFATYAMFWIRQTITRGRDVEGGSGRRGALAAGGDFHAPLSLDADYYNHDTGPTLADLLVDDTDEAGQIVDGISVARVLDECKHPIERELLLTIAAGLPLADVARRHGVSDGAVRVRYQRLRVRLQHALCDVAS